MLRFPKMKMEERELVMIECLPVEIQEDILQNNVLTYKDIVSFSTTCRRFRELVNGSNKVWKKKFLQMWPTLQYAFNQQKMYDWKTEFTNRFCIGLFVQKRLSEFSAKFIEVDEISDSEFEDFKSKMDNCYLNYCYMVDELKSLFASDMNSKLTKKYYGVKVMRFLKQEHLKNVWQDFGKLPPEQQLLETGAVFVAQWCQPLADVSTSDIASFCDDVAEKVKLVVKSKNSSHTLLSVSPDQLNEWKARNISDNQFSCTESKQILNAVCMVLFQHYCFCADNERHQFLETAMFNWVIEHRTGTALMISIIIESVARRLGVKCEVVVFPSHLLLRWKEQYKPSDKEYDGSSPSSYIDVFNAGQFLTKRSCPRFSSLGVCPMNKQSIDAANALQVVEYLASDVLTAIRREGGHSGKSSRVRSGLELLVVVNPSNPYNVLRAARFYTDYQLDSKFLLEILAELQRTAHDADRHQLQLFSYALNQQNLHKTSTVQATPKHNDGTVKYAMGMIMQHRQYGYRCVVYGWDYYCKATPEWILQMGVGNLEYKTDQPFYNVLVTDGSTRYAAQENLEVHPDPHWIEHPLVGRYFDTFCGTHYTPNEEKALEYPDDENIRTHYVTHAEQLMES